MKSILKRINNFLVLVILFNIILPKQSFAQKESGGISTDASAGSGGSGPDVSQPSLTGAPMEYSPSEWDNISFLANNGTRCPLIKEEESHKSEIETIIEKIQTYNRSVQDQACQIQYVDGGQSQLELIRNRLIRQNQRSVRAQLADNSCDEEVYRRSFDIQLNATLRRAQAHFNGSIGGLNRLPGKYERCSSQLITSYESLESCLTHLQKLLINEHALDCKDIADTAEVRAERERERSEFQQEAERRQLRDEIEHAALMETFGAFSSVMNNDNCDASDLIPHFLSAAEMTLPSLLVGGGGQAFQLASGALNTLFSAVRGILEGDNPSAEDLIAAMRHEDAMNDQLCLNYELQQSALQCQQRRELYTSIVSSAQSELKEINSCRQSLLDTTPESGLENNFVNLSSLISSSTSRPGESPEDRRDQIVTLSNILNENLIPYNSDGDTQLYPKFLKNTFEDFSEYLNRDIPRGAQRRLARTDRQDLERRIGESINQNNNISNGEDIAREILLSLARLENNDHPEAAELISNYNSIMDYDENSSSDSTAVALFSSLTEDEAKMRLHRYLPDAMPFIISTLAENGELRERERRQYEVLEERETMALRIRALNNFEGQVNEELANMQARLRFRDDGTEVTDQNERQDNLASLLIIQGMYTESNQLRDHVSGLIDSVNATESSTVGSIRAATDERKQNMINILRSEQLSAKEQIDAIQEYETQSGLTGTTTSNKLKKLHTLISNCVIGQNNLSIQNNTTDSIIFEDTRNNQLEQCERILDCAPNYHSPADNLGNRTLTGGNDHLQVRDIMCNNMARVDEFFGDIAERYINQGRVPNCNGRN